MFIFDSEGQLVSVLSKIIEQQDKIANEHLVLRENFKLLKIYLEEGRSAALDKFERFEKRLDDAGL